MNMYCVLSLLLEKLQKTTESQHPDSHLHMQVQRCSQKGCIEDTTSLRVQVTTHIILNAICVAFAATGACYQRCPLLTQQ